MNEITIKPVRLEDHAVWRDLWTGYLIFYESSVPEAVYTQTFTRLLNDTPYDPNGLLAWHKGAAVGLVHYLFHRHCWKVENICYLQDLFTVPSARGLGVGRALIQAVYEAADSAGCHDVYWNTAEDNYYGRLLYDRVGQRTPFIKYKR